MGPNTEYACKNFKAIHCVFPAGNAVVAATEVEEIVDAQWRDLGMRENPVALPRQGIRPLKSSPSTPRDATSLRRNKVVFNERKEKVYEEICKHVSFIK